MGMFVGDNNGNDNFTNHSLDFNDDTCMVVHDKDD